MSSPRVQPEPLPSWPAAAPTPRRRKRQGLPLTSRLPACRGYIEKYPDLDVVIDHLADCPIDAPPEELDSLLTLAQFPRVYCKISHTWVLSRQAYPYRDTWGLVKKVYDAFEPERRSLQ